MTMAISRVAACQAGWGICVLGAAAGRPWDGPAFIAALAAVLIAATPAGARAGRLQTLALAALAGTTFDGALVALGFLEFPAGSPGWPVPVWMIALWINFALALDVAARALGVSLTRAAVAGALGGSASYVAGARLAAVSLQPSVPVAAVAVGLEWAIAMPLLLAVHARCTPHVSARETTA